MADHMTGDWVITNWPRHPLRRGFFLATSLTWCLPEVEVDEGPETIDRAFRKVVAAAPKRPPRKSEKGD